MKLKSITEIIKENYLLLSPGQKKVAEFITQNIAEGALLTAFQMGNRVGVSETTVIRLAYALGFKGYIEMQNAVRQNWLRKQHPDTKEEFPQETHTDEKSIFRKVIEKEQSVLTQLLEQINTDEIWHVCDQLIQADRVYIGAFGSSYGAAYWLYYTLRQYRENVLISSPTGFSLEDIYGLNQQSVLVIFSFPRYRKQSLELIERAQSQGVKTIAVTNSQLSPVGQLAEVTLTTEKNADSGHHSIASVISLAEIILAGIEERDHDRVSLRQQKLEQVYTEHGLFLE
ncbi:MurR/RpiR family transcriptional regulator [Virgibacillus dakarensis]|uniref:MurR/RpiR family transcriptional regulator n=1 Tax=Virgibacillus dakarensis TaxID=1917889 RepID=UPI000B436DB1|nr:MurR/RpiR family transcriptional regulator [Virgibacillus dakarensis]MBT2215584.1 MurR/RpiR family transcriptional regulator [Virgibacillus dakarensis]